MVEYAHHQLQSKVVSNAHVNQDSQENTVKPVLRQATLVHTARIRLRHVKGTILMVNETGGITPYLVIKWKIKPLQFIVILIKNQIWLGH